MIFIRDINLGFYKYAPLLLKGNKVIEHVSILQPDNEEFSYVAYAYLCKNLILNWPKNVSVYGAAHGTGTDQNKRTAIYKAISEALERWAFFTMKSRDPNGAGFDINGSSDGFAAFPGMTKSGAKINSVYESLERTALSLFSVGRLSLCQRLEYSRQTLPNKKQSVFQCYTYGLSNIVDFKIGSEVQLVILHAYDDEYDFHFYGFACRENYEKALAQAVAEASRNQRMLRKFLENHQIKTQSLMSFEEIGDTFNLYHNEVRLLFFATELGYAHFKNLVLASQDEPKKTAAQVRTIFSKEIIGPWSRYATVWRTLHSPQIAERQDKSNYKFFVF